ncbi:MAG: hypothetical protein IKY52_11070 [Clostridia bacterium]|nr:hypothetical protein [Clostridia bacterium]
MSTPIICEFCGAVLSPTNAHEFDDRIFCEHCLDARTTLCDCCMDRIWRDEAEVNGMYTLCHYCYDHNYTTCRDCGRLIHNDDVHYSDDDDEPYCQDCYDKHYNDAIHNYHYKPSPIFYGDEGSLFMGVELEIDEAGEDSHNADLILEIGRPHLL